ncbi:hypothetical protein AWC09_19555 [Mycolicibacter hiberniae]|nr:hypothetical protein AWC09_19555 [Mycolicibacter hiberniae]
MSPPDRVAIQIARPCAAVFLEQRAFAGPPVGGGQCTLQEIAHVQGDIAAPHHLPVQEADVAIGQHVGVAESACWGSMALANTVAGLLPAA